tara:strand:- start:931 stop:1143 length:213 start_codon:yes stop_codon:yes gene_type:complete
MESTIAHGSRVMNIPVLDGKSPDDIATKLPEYSEIAASTDLSHLGQSLLQKKAEETSTSLSFPALIHAKI